MIREFDRRRCFLVQAMNDIPGVSCITPQGAFYTFPTFQGYDLNSVQLATYLLREAHIACVPGTAFGTSGEGYVRMAYSADYDSIEAGIERMHTALVKYRKG